MKVRFGMCGLGFAGSVLMAPDLNAHPEVQVVSACDPNDDVRSRFGKDYGIPTYPELEAMLRAEKLDAIYIGTPHQFHCDHVVQAAARGLHVIVDKPLAITVADADRMAEAVRRAGVHLVVGPSRGNDPVVRKMREIVMSGAVGRLAMLNCWNYTDFLYRPRRSEELDTSRGGGIVFNQLPHQIDSIKAISGQQIVSVLASTGGLDPARPTEGHCVALLTLSGGASASMVYSGYDHFDSDELHFWVGEGGGAKKPGHGNARRVLRELNGMTEAQLRAQRYGYGGPVAAAVAAGRESRRQAHFGIMVATCERADLRPSADGVLVYGDDGVREVPVAPTRGANRLSDTTIEELLDAIAGRAPALRTVEWGVDTVKVCAAILESSRTGAPVGL